MYFDPLSSWLVALIANGVNIAGEKLDGNSAQNEYDRERIKRGNEWLNIYIRQIRDKHGTRSPEFAFEQIQLHITTTKESLAFKYTNAPIVINLENQEYIISVLEACAQVYEGKSYKHDPIKAEWFKSAAVEAKRKKELYAMELERAKIKEAHDRERDQLWTTIFVVIGVIVAVVFLIYLFL